jgi:hypothetical protein
MAALPRVCTFGIGRYCNHYFLKMLATIGQGSGFRVQGAGFRVQVAGFRVQGSGFRVQVSGYVI